MSTAAEERLHTLALIVKSIRTGELTAAARLRERLAPDVALHARAGDATGPAEVTRLLSGQWAFTPTLRRAHWSLPRPAGDDLVVEAQFPEQGATPERVALRVGFDGEGRARRIDYETDLWAPPVLTDAMADHVRAAIDDALGNGTPLVLSYVGPDGAPRLSLRGSVQTAGPLELTLWARKAAGFVDAIDVDPRVVLLYRNSPTRTTLTITGRATVVQGDRRRRIYELSPEVEQLHDPSYTGIAVIIDVDRVQGSSPQGMVVVERPA